MSLEKVTPCWAEGAGSLLRSTSVAAADQPVAITVRNKGRDIGLLNFI